MPNTEERTRIAVVQLETHPAARYEDIDFLSEPFMPKDNHPALLAHLRSHSGGQHIKILQDRFRRQYLKWSETRLRSVLDWIQKLDLEDRPQLIVFSEFAVPFEHLHIVRDSLYQPKNKEGIKAVIIAGTHSYSGDKDAYKTLVENCVLPPSGTHGAFDEKEPNSGVSASVLVAMGPSQIEPDKSPSLPSVFRRFKVKYSPFEFTSTHIEDRSPFDQGIPEAWVWKIGAYEPVQIFICSEALQAVAASGNSSIIVTSAYHSKPNDFQRIIEPAVYSGKIAVLANDGRYGGSTIVMAHDNRPTSWWWRDHISGKLPPGDAILVYEASTDRNGSINGLANPWKQDRLVALASIVSSSLTDEEFLFAVELQDIVNRHGMAEQKTVARKIRQALHRSNVNELQDRKARLIIALAEKDQLTPAARKCLGRDCIMVAE